MSRFVLLTSATLSPRPDSNSHSLTEIFSFAASLPEMGNKETGHPLFDGLLVPSCEAFHALGGSVQAELLAWGSRAALKTSGCVLQRPAG